MLQPELYSKLSQSKVITEAALRSGISKGAINRRTSERRGQARLDYPEREGGKPKVNAAWDAIGEVIKAWATEGHAVAIPGLGSMRLASPSLLRHGIAQASLALRMAQSQPSACAHLRWPM